MMNVDSSGNMVVSPISVRGQERLARLRASIQHQFGNSDRAAASRSINMDAHAHQQQPRSKIRQRIEQASKMTSDDIFFREFGSPKKLMALDFDLARTEQPRLASRHVDLSGHSTTAIVNSDSVRSTTQYANGPQPSFSNTSSAQAEQSRFDHASAANRSHLMHDSSHPSSRSSAHITAAASERVSSMAPSAASQHGRAVERPAAYVSQLQRPTRILTPKKQSLKRQRSADELPSAEKAAAMLQPPPAQKPRLLNDVTSTFNNRSFSNVGQARGTHSSNVHTSNSSANTFMNSPVRKAAPTFARKTTLMQLPSPSKSNFRVPTSTTRLFGQRQSSYR